MQLLLSGIGFLLAAATWTLAEIADRLRPPERSRSVTEVTSKSGRSIRIDGETDART
jgi:hypothetical protein